MKYGVTVAIEQIEHIGLVTDRKLEINGVTCSKRKVSRVCAT